MSPEPRGRTSGRLGRAVHRGCSASAGMYRATERSMATRTIARGWMRQCIPPDRRNRPPATARRSAARGCRRRTVRVGRGYGRAARSSGRGGGGRSGTQPGGRLISLPFSSSSDPSISRSSRGRGGVRMMIGSAGGRPGGLGSGPGAIPSRARWESYRHASDGPPSSMKGFTPTDRRIDRGRHTGRQTLPAAPWLEANRRPRRQAEEWQCDVRIEVAIHLN